MRESIRPDARSTPGEAQKFLDAMVVGRQIKRRLAFEVICEQFAKRYGGTPRRNRRSMALALMKRRRQAEGNGEIGSKQAVSA